MKRQYGFLKRILAIFLIVVLLLSVSGCEFISDIYNELIDRQKLPMPTGVTIPGKTETTQHTQPEQSDSLALDALRKQLLAEGKVFAVAYLGYMQADCADVWSYIGTLSQKITQKMPFLNQIPQTNNIDALSYGDVYCIILADPNTTMEVYTGAEDAAFDNLVYEGSGEDPFLLVCNTFYSPDTAVVFTEKNVRCCWNPKLDDYLYVDLAGTDEAWDISDYNEILLAYYETLQVAGSWSIPAKTDLEGTTWRWDGYTQDGDYYEYSVSFQADTADLRWNPGSGETTEYMNAPWTYKEDPIGVLTMDFGEFAGVRAYNLLVDWDAGMLYIAVDATGKKLTWDSEPQYRFLLLNLAGNAQPMDLVGTWERVLTEVDGDVNETPAGQVIVTITGTSETDLQITYKDKEFPDSNFAKKVLTIVPDGDNMGLGGAEWIAEVDHVGKYGKTYALAIVDGQLVIRNYFEIDGALGVSYETFKKVD